MKMILITGHKGMIGSRLFNRLLNPIGIDIKDGIDVLTCDLPEATTIFHLAAQSSVEASWKDPVHDIDNVKLVTRICHRYPKAKIIYAASAAGLSTSPYGFSKEVGSMYLQAFHRNAVICYLPNIYGQRGGKSVVDIFKEAEKVTVYGDGLQTRSYVHVDDIVEGLYLAQKWPQGKYYLGSGVSTTVLELAAAKDVTFAPARQESKEAVLPNTTPNWKPIINVMDYICE